MSMLRKTKQQIAHTSMIPSLGNRDLRSLQDIINSEKSFIKNNAVAAQSWHTNAESLKAWADDEGDDLNDILGKMSLLFDNYTTAHTRLNTHLSTLRLHFKSIRTREEGLAELKSRKRSLQSKIESVEKKLTKMGPENKELMKTTTTLKDYRNEMESLNMDLATEEAAIGDFKRRTTKEAMGLKCGGLLEFAEKVTIMAEIGKMIIEEIPLNQTKPGMPRDSYGGHARTEQLLQEATRAISDVGFAPSGAAPHPRPDLSHLDSSLPLNDEYEQHQRQQRSYSQTDPRGNDEGRYDDPYTGGHGTYDSQADYNDNTTTPIYASHQTTQPWLKDSASQRSLSQQQSQLHTEGLEDGSNWQRDEENAHSGGDAPAAVVEEPGWGRSSGQEHEHNESTPPAAPVVDRPNSSDTAPSLPPLRASSPLPSANASEQPVPNNTTTAVDDDESYFTSIGSTRAAQAAARRPHSPQPASPYGSNAPTSFGAAAAATSGTLPTTPSGSTYEPSDSGRKMTAAAFRKGFNRAPSGQHLGLKDETSAGIPSRENTASPSVPPLAIRKRHSAIVDAEPSLHHNEAAPPYPMNGGETGTSQDNHSAYETNYAYAPPPVVGQMYNGPGSRPGSSSGHNQPYSYPQQQQQQPYPPQQQQQSGYNMPGYASYAAGPNH
ncbi:unnamed protein product [Sympodiomycopsis kandeliae]